MLKLLYSAGLALASIFLLPRLLKSDGKIKLQRQLGKNIPLLHSSASERIWVHAVSLGETKAIIPLLKKIKEQKPEAFIIFSTTTATGQNEARQFFPEADRHIYLPSDLVIRNFVKEAKPTLVILSETDFWYNFLDEAKKQGAFIVLANGKLSEKSAKFYKLAHFFFNKLFSKIDLFLVQSRHYRQRFIELKIPEDKVFVTGNLKVDGAVPLLIPPSSLGANSRKDPVIVIGSTHDPEEKLFLEALKQVWPKYPNLKVYLVPRHPERFDAVAKLIQSEGIAFSRLSQYQEDLLPHVLLPKERLILVDKMGHLKNLYQKADFCFVAGSFTSKVGGHNILEPCLYAKATLFGPFMFSQPDFLEQVLFAGAGLQIKENEIASTIVSLVENPEFYQEMGRRGRQIIEENQGSVEKSLHIINHKC